VNKKAIDPRQLESGSFFRFITEFIYLYRNQLIKKLRNPGDKKYFFIKSIYMYRFP
jgi:hypothetical protein